MSENILSQYKQAQAIWQASEGGGMRNDLPLARWIDGPDGPQFWYKRATKAGAQFRLVSAATGANEALFDHAALAAALAQASGEETDPEALPLRDLHISVVPTVLKFTAFDQEWQYAVDTGICSASETKQPKDDDSDRDFFYSMLPTHHNLLTSPDGTKAAFTRDNNVWVLDLASGEETELTSDGVEELAYGRDQYMATYIHGLWSPDSRQFLTVQVDTRGVAIRHTVGYATPGSSRVQVSEIKAAYCGDEKTNSYRVLAIDVESGKLQMADYPLTPVLMSGDMPEYGIFGVKPWGWWQTDNRRAYFVDLARGAKTASIVEFDTGTGETRVIFEEKSDTFLRLQHQHNDSQTLFQPLVESGEFIWYSEKTDWGHLYLHDLETGELKHAITQGEWIVRDVLHVDLERRELLIQTAGRDAEISPYYRDICRVNIDTGELTPLITGNYEHVVMHPMSIVSAISWSRFCNPMNDLQSSVPPNGVSPCGNYLVVTRSRVDTVPETLLIDREGNEIGTLEIADVSDMPDWYWPEPVKLKAADGKTDIYGVVYRPPSFSENKSYPVLNFSNSVASMSALPQGSGKNSFLGIWYMMAASYAALGFIVVAIDGRGLNLRHKSFQDHAYGRHQKINDLEDRIAGIRQLAERYPYMDLDRVGVTADENANNNHYALIKHPDFFKVCVVNCLVDTRQTFAGMAENYLGSLDDGAMAAEEYYEEDIEAFKGKLFLIAGGLSQVAVPSTMRLVEALQKANKNFDMLILPNLVHSVSSYSLRREWDFLVRHLRGVEPPRDFRLISGEIYEAVG